MKNTSLKFIPLLLVTLSACSSNEVWQTNVEPSSSHIISVLDDHYQTNNTLIINIEDAPIFTVPQSVRPCCAFGNIQKVSIKGLPIPLIRLNNVVDISTIGPHKFDSGIYHYTASKESPHNNYGGENNGLIYTLKGGFIDLAHVRDTADDTVALHFQIFKYLGSAHRIELPTELGDRHITLKEVNIDYLTIQDRWELSATLAARLAYFKAEGHEIAQWHGFNSFTYWPEELSAYSVEDLYSNMLGAKLSYDLIVQKKMLSERDYNRNMTLWIHQALIELEAVDSQTTSQLLELVDGHWWDSTVAIPNKFLLLKRHYIMSDVQSPHLIPDVLLENHYKEFINTDKVVLSISKERFGLSLDDIAHLYLEIDEQYKPSFRHIPKKYWVNGIPHTQFNIISTYDKKADDAQLSEKGE